MNAVTSTITPRLASIGVPRWVLILTTFLSVAVALVSYRYFVPSVPVPPNIAANHFFSPWLMLHVASAATALLIGPAQFFPRLRASAPQVHRWVGRAYVVACCVGGVTGVALAAGVSTGPIASAGFGLLGILWFATTVLGWRRAVQRRIADHRAWMIRSFALTLAAVTLRLYLALSGILPFDEDNSYRAISFLCWVPNLILAEIYLQRRKRKTAEAARTNAENVPS